MPRFLVTAGNTREMIDRVRDWGNIFTGNTGFGIAKALLGVGDVDLLTSNPAHLAEGKALGMTTVAFRSHADLRQCLAERVTPDAYAGIFMTAAVADYTPVRTYAVSARTINDDGTEVWVVRDVQAGKVKSDHPAMAVFGERTAKLVDKFRATWGHRGLLVKFKLEVGLSKEQLLEIGEKSRVASGADYLVANTLDMVDGDAAGAYLLSEHEKTWVPRGGLAAACATLARAAR